MPNTVVLECLLEKNKKQAPAKDQQQSAQPAPKKQDISLLPQPQQQQAKQPQQRQEAPPAKSKPKIEVVSEVTNYNSMIVENSVKDGKLHYTIELDQIESFASIELDISSTELKITSAEDKYPRFIRSLLFEASLPVKVDTDSAEAKWLKKKHHLKLICAVVN